MAGMKSYRKRLIGDHCIYCGGLPTARDHFPPKSLCYGGFIFPCCIECNNAAGTEYPFDFWKRAEYVQTKRKIRYWNVKWYLGTLGIEEHELNYLGNRLV